MGALFGPLALGASLLQGVVASRGAKARASGIEGQAALSDLQAKGDILRGKEQATNELEKLNEQLASNNARIGFAGLDPGLSPSVAATIRRNLEDAGETTSLIEAQAGTVAGTRRTQSAQLRASAQATKGGGIFSLITGGLRGAAGIAKRGSFAGIRF